MSFGSQDGIKNIKDLSGQMHLKDKGGRNRIGQGEPSDHDAGQPPVKEEGGWGLGKRASRAALKKSQPG